MLSMIMNDGVDESGILRLALTSVNALGPCRAEAGFLTLGKLLVRAPAEWPHATADLDDQLQHARKGPIPVPGREWGWAFALHGRGGGPGERHGPAEGTRPGRGAAAAQRTVRP
ncbi:hypothetical protein ACFWDI_40830 [Streptomyces sp. NPDC060064]|uniref:hypothetical protein n=1 Tax=Streptomyces sp. NPDC060064 TaxID=3347049 RepID=UPI0036CF1363